ncbi:MAG TPA: hypothetical protein VH393_08630 [Ktedonobacterales bacterium]|jgi:hypothetical protein
MATALVDLGQVSELTEIVLRAGNARQANARRVLQKAYRAVDPTYPDAVGIMALFRPGATLDELARQGSFPQAKLRYTIVGRMLAELNAAGYELVLFVTPTSALPDRHSLAVARGGMALRQLPDDAGDSLLRALDVAENPYRNRASAQREKAPCDDDSPDVRVWKSSRVRATRCYSAV